MEKLKVVQNLLMLDISVLDLVSLLLLLVVALAVAGVDKVGPVSEDEPSDCVDLQDRNGIVVCCHLDQCCLTFCNQFWTMRTRSKTT